MLHLIFNGYWDICLLRESPENMTYSISRMIFTGILLTIILMIEWSSSYNNLSEDIAKIAFISVCLVISYLAYTYLILFFKGLTARLVQTITSLYVINIILHIFVIPLLLIAPYLSFNHSKNPLFLIIYVIYLFLSLGISIWQIVIISHIYKFAFNVTGFQSVLAAFGLIAFNILTVSLLQ